MATPQHPVVIKTFANRRLYDPIAGSYVSLEDLTAMMEDNQDFIVREFKSGEDVTRSILKQIIVRRANHG